MEGEPKKNPLGEYREGDVVTMTRSRGLVGPNQRRSPQEINDSYPRRHYFTLAKPGQSSSVGFRTSRQPRERRTTLVQRDVQKRLI
ncbi:hypothetical protein C922_00002 [Plasmodium inui San Antonio 1]|uniref:Uncharacterized protein n=1 Tax=Plasmodium inui San Antonio 1 TaxID=1237626 RepID=W7AJX3_9APIC|nr:hypothetical protein C922_00002 [Plasmodium inui San Antonio 1]EUD69139.1 hypothetical protein C922_00002 [Plasmodium inui San Antonio 1]